MAASMKSVFSVFLLCSLLLLLLFSTASNAHPLKACMFDAIYQLGDSISDTGNLIRENPMTPFSQLPYGETFFNNATGRCSNGLLMIDYFAMSAGLPLLNPYLNKEASLMNGVNFAVAGSTALSSEVLAQMNISSPVTNSSLTKQLDWMSAHFNTICSNQTDCYEKLKDTLFLVEIGGNDYNYALFQGKTVEESKNMVPQVVETIKDAVQKVIDYGAARVIVPGNFPIGCLPIYLTGFRTNDTTAYDEFHCLNDLNSFARYHNDYLKQAIEALNKENPHAMVIYGDYYNALSWVIQHASSLGFEEEYVQKACCGSGGDYDFNLRQMCGLPGVPVCPNPDERISWDGVHSTQKAYHYMTNWLIHDIFPKLHCVA